MHSVDRHRNTTTEQKYDIVKTAKGFSMHKAVPALRWAQTAALERQCIWCVFQGVAF